MCKNNSSSSHMIKRGMYLVDWTEHGFKAPVKLCFSRTMSDVLTLEGLMSGLFLGELENDPDHLECDRVVRTVEGIALAAGTKNAGYDSDDELEPADRWHRCLDAVRSEWELWKSECPSLHPWHRKEGYEMDNRLHLEDVLMRLGDTWRARDFLLGLMDARDHDDEDTMINHRECDLRPMALFMLAVVRAEELEAEGLRVTRAVRKKYGDAGLPIGLEGLLGGQRSLRWWLRETGQDQDAGSGE